jgi:predicted nucleotidyltransferase
VVSLSGIMLERTHRKEEAMGIHIEVDTQKIAEFCRAHRIARLAFFGSVLRDDFRPDSDVDVLISFEPGCEVGLITLAGIEIELSQILGRKADLRTPEDLSRYFRDKVVSTAEVLYAA